MFRINRSETTSRTALTSDMAYRIRYSLRARQEMLELLEYISSEYGRKKAEEIYDKIEKILIEISKMPEMCRVSQKQKDLRQCVLSKQTSIYYRIRDNCIEVVSFRPNRKDSGSI